MKKKLSKIKPSVNYRETYRPPIPFQKEVRTYEYEKRITIIWLILAFLLIIAVALRIHIL